MKRQTGLNRDVTVKPGMPYTITQRHTCAQMPGVTSWPVFQAEWFMKNWISAASTAAFIGCVLVPVSTSAQPNSSAPQSGQWELSVTRQGAPSGSGKELVRACLAQDRLDNGAEAVFFAAAQGKDKGRPSCAVSEVQRDGAKSTWKTTCEGPFGKMYGTGEGTLATQAVDLTQVIEVRAPLGSLTLKQSVNARRTGECQ
jgi:hypothetical protein